MCLSLVHKQLALFQNEMENRDHYTYIFTLEIISDICINIMMAKSWKPITDGFDHSEQKF